MNVIKKRRLELGHTRIELARLSGVKYATLAQWETGYSVPKRESLLSLSKIIGVDAGQIRDDLIAGAGLCQK